MVRVQLHFTLKCTLVITLVLGHRHMEYLCKNIHWMPIDFSAQVSSYGSRQHFHLLYSKLSKWTPLPKKRISNNIQQGWVDMSTTIAWLFCTLLGFLPQRHILKTIVLIWRSSDSYKLHLSSQNSKCCGLLQHSYGTVLLKRGFTIQQKRSTQQNSHQFHCTFVTRLAYVQVFQSMKNIILTIESKTILWWEAVKKWKILSIRV